MPSIILPKTGGGQASFVDVTDTTAAAADVASGKYFYTSSGVLTQGTSSGGGGGLVYERGSFKPSEDIARPTISFANTHTSLPIFIDMYDTSPESTSTTNSNVYFTYTDSLYLTGGIGFPRTASNRYYGHVLAGYRSSSGVSGYTSQFAYPSTNTTDTSSPYPRYFVSLTNFRPSMGTTRYWRAGRTYEWIAVWAPTS